MVKAILPALLIGASLCAQTRSPMGQLNPGCQAGVFVAVNGAMLCAQLDPRIQVDMTTTPPTLRLSIVSGAAPTVRFIEAAPVSQQGDGSYVVLGAPAGSAVTITLVTRNGIVQNPVPTFTWGGKTVLGDYAVDSTDKSRPIIRPNATWKWDPTDLVLVWYRSEQ